MAQLGKIEAESQMKCSPAKIYSFFKYDMAKLVDIFPQRFQGAKTVEGENGCVGHVQLYKYDIDIGPMTCKAIYEAIDDVERSVTYASMEGDINKLYKTFKAKVTVSDFSVKWCIEFEKINESVPSPDIYATLVTEVCKVLDAYLLNQQN